MDACYTFTVLVTIFLVAWGLMDFLAKQGKNEDDTKVIIRQLKGVGVFLLALVVFTIGISFCSRGGIWTRLFGANSI